MVKSKELTKKPTDWSDKEHVKMLIQQRKFMWNEDYVALLAKLIGLKAGKSIADIGCGLGYLGHLYGKFIIPNGKYIGVDNDNKLLQMACKTATNQKLSELSRFVQGNVLKIPLKDESVDVTMCQTLLMHLKEPESAVRELIRITKKHGKVIAFEVSWVASKWSNFPEVSLKEELENINLSYRTTEGRKKLGLGDFRIGEKVPYLFMKNRLKNIEVRKNDKVGNCLISPYDTPEFKYRSKETLKSMEKYRKRTRGEKRKDYLKEKKSYIAGGGDAKTFKKLMRRRRRRYEKNYRKIARMIKEKKLYSVSTCPFYIIIGEK